MAANRFLKLALLGFFLVASALIQYQAHQLGADQSLPGMTHPLEGEPAPPFSLADDQGEQVRLEDFRGQVVILDFWATWCGPCRRSFPVLEKLQQEKPDLVVLAINLKESAQEVEAYLSEEGFEARVLFDSEGSVGEAYQVRSIPTQVLIDRSGTIKAVEVGYSPVTFVAFRSRVDRELAR